MPTAAINAASKAYRLAYISSSCPDVSNFIPNFPALIEESDNMYSSRHDQRHVQDVSFFLISCTCLPSSILTSPLAAL
jgi:hypothetical protein